jgi:alpha-ribazole phosphatase
MSLIYLIRHTTPTVSKGICYGQSDIDLTESFDEEASVIKKHLTEQIEHVYSSPLMRCTKLAEYLFPKSNIQLYKDLMEINCGNWEMKQWDLVPKKEIDPWMNDFVNARIPGGESYVDLYKRTANCFEEIVATGNHSAIITHGGVIRSILSHITQTPLIESFNIFSIHYGCVVKITVRGRDLRHEIVSNIPAEKEKHKPSYS